MEVVEHARRALARARGRDAAPVGVVVARVPRRGRARLGVVAHVAERRLVLAPQERRDVAGDGRERSPPVAAGARVDEHEERVPEGPPLAELALALRVLARVRAELRQPPRVEPVERRVRRAQLALEAGQVRVVPAAVGHAAGPRPRRRLAAHLVLALLDHEQILRDDVDGPRPAADQTEQTPDPRLLEVEGLLLGLPVAELLRVPQALLLVPQPLHLRELVLALRASFPHLLDLLDKVRVARGVLRAVPPLLLLREVLLLLPRELGAEVAVPEGVVVVGVAHDLVQLLLLVLLLLLLLLLLFSLAVVAVRHGLVKGAASVCLSAAGGARQGARRANRRPGRWRRLKNVARAGSVQCHFTPVAKAVAPLAPTDTCCT